MFNRSHSGSYAIQAYQDMWLKVRYPLIFYSVLLTFEEKKTALILREARAFDISVLPPDVNVSGDGFTVDHDAGAIRYGLRGISGIGDAAADQILADRPFIDLDDFIKRSSRKYSKVNKASREKLLRVGALDRFHARADWTAKDRAVAELELLGVALEPGGILGDDAPIVRENIYTEQEVADAAEGDRVIVAGKVSGLKVTAPKRGRTKGIPMGIFTVTLDLDVYKVVAFPEVWDTTQDLLTSGELLILSGRRDDRGGVILSQAMNLESFVAEARAEVAA